MIESRQYQVIHPLRNGIDDRRVINPAFGVRYIMADKENKAIYQQDMQSVMQVKTW